MKARIAHVNTAQSASVAASVDRAEGASSGSVFGETSAQGSALETRINQSPRMLAQRHALQTAFGAAFRRDPSAPRETMQTAGVARNSSGGLERETDLMGGQTILQRAGMKGGRRQHQASTLPLVVQRYIELGRPDNPSPEENELEPQGKIRNRDGTFAKFDWGYWYKGIAYRAHHYENHFGFEEGDSEQADRWVRIQRWLREEMSSELHDAPAVEAVKYTMELTRLPLENLQATTSGSYSLTIFPENADFVVQHLRPSAFKSLMDMHAALKDAPAEVLAHVAEIRSLDEGRRIAVVEKIRPLNTIFAFFGGAGNLRSAEELKAFVKQNAAKLKRDGLKAIRGLASRGISQGDVSFDNMGIKNGNFALFDYDKANSEHPDSDSDVSNLGKSFKTRGGIDMASVDEESAASEITGL